MGPVQTSVQPQASESADLPGRSSPTQPILPTTRVDFFAEHIAHELTRVLRARKKSVSVRELKRWLQDR
jgi:hypothetical protein